MMTSRLIRSRRVAPWRHPSASPGARSDDELLLAVGAGDHQAFATLSEYMAGLVRANIWRALQDKTETDMVTDAVLAEVWRQAAGFDPTRTRAVLWILDLAHRLATEHDRHDHAVSANSRVAAPMATRW